MRSIAIAFRALAIGYLAATAAGSPALDLVSRNHPHVVKPKVFLIDMVKPRITGREARGQLLN